MSGSTPDEEMERQSARAGVPLHRRIVGGGGILGREGNLNLAVDPSWPTCCTFNVYQHARGSGPRLLKLNQR